MRTFPFNKVIKELRTEIQDLPGFTFPWSNLHFSMI